MANEITNTKQQRTTELSVLKKVPTLLDVRMDSKTYPRLLTMDEAEAKVQLGVIVMMAQQYRGQNIDPDTNETLVNSLYSELMDDPDKLGLRYLTMEEIKRVVKRAVSGNTNKEIFGINVASLLTVLTEYAKGEGAELQKQVEHQSFLRQGDLRYQQLAACAKILAANMKP